MTNSKNSGIGGCLFFAIALPVTLLLILLAIGSIFFFVFRSEYLKWETNFESKRFYADDSATVIEGDNSKSKRESIQDKIDKFSKSERKVDVVEFDKSEALVLLGDQLQKSLPKDFTVYRMYADTDKNSWIVYIQLKYKGYILPWVVMHVEKDNIETAQIYISSVYIGNINFEDYGMSWIRHNINDGISSALVLVNQNNFTGRSFDNVGLEKDKVVVKGTL